MFFVLLLQKLTDMNFSTHFLRYLHNYVLPPRQRLPGYSWIAYKDAVSEQGPLPGVQLKQHTLHSLLFGPPYPLPRGWSGCQAAIRGIGLHSAICR